VRDHIHGSACNPAWGGPHTSHDGMFDRDEMLLRWPRAMVDRQCPDLIRRCGKKWKFHYSRSSVERAVQDPDWQRDAEAAMHRVVTSCASRGDGCELGIGDRIIECEYHRAMRRQMLSPDPESGGTAPALEYPHAQS
jgi:hypothetical protein